MTRPELLNRLAVWIGKITEADKPTLADASHLVEDLGLDSLALAELAARTRGVPMLARTHGQPASPTTLGKELAVFVARLTPMIEELGHGRPHGKLNGATGTFGAHLAAYPDHDWVAFAARFVGDLGLKPAPVTTQIEPQDWLAAQADLIRRVNNVLLDLDQDMWRYISAGTFRQRVVATEVGSSAMPHKVNPIDFENAEGNLGLANALWAFLADKLTRSRLQRDLSGSTVLRNVGTAFGHTLLAYQGTLAGLQKLDPDEAAMAAELAAHPEVLAEAYQSVLRARGHELPYERLKDLTRGRRVTLVDLHALVTDLDVDGATRHALLAFEPSTYVGAAERLAGLALADAARLLGGGHPCGS
jgi:adenylosuccinate lyase